MLKGLVLGGLITVCGHAIAAPPSSVYTWVDTQGVRHYSDQPNTPQNRPTNHHTPPAKLKEMVVDRPATPAPSTNDAPSATTPPASSDTLTKNWEQGANANERLAPTRAAACEVAQRNVQVLSDTKRPAYKRNAEGQPVAMDDAVRTTELTRAQKDVESYCGAAKTQ